MRRTILVVLFLAIVVMAGDCGGDDEEFDPGEATEATEAAEETEDTAPVAVEGEDPSDDAGSGDAAREPDSTITGVDSGTFVGESWVRVDLTEPFLPGEERVRYSIEFVTDEGDRIVASWNVEPSGDPFSTSFCFGEDTPSCPDGIFPIVAVPGQAGDTLVFTFSLDAFANATNPRYGAFVEVGPSDEPAARAVFDYLDGEQFPLSTEERDPG